MAKKAGDGRFKAASDEPEPAEPGNGGHENGASLSDEDEAQEGPNEAQGDIKEGCPETLFRKADDLVKDGRKRDAMKAYQEILDTCEGDSRAAELAHWGLGELALELADAEFAKRHLSEALKLNPDSGDYLFLMGLAHLQADDPEAAIGALREADRLKPGVTPIIHKLGYALAYMGEDEEGQELLRRALKQDPDNPYILTDLGIALAAAGNTEEALACVEKADKLAPDEKYVTGWLSRIRQMKDEGYIVED